MRGQIPVTSVSRPTVLADGKVLFTLPAQLWDPAYSSHSTSTLLTDGKVLLAGRESDEVGRSAGAEFYDPATAGTFKEA